MPKEISALIQSDFLCETLLRIKNVWVLDNEKACRIVIDAILTEVLLNEANETLSGFCEVKNDWEGILNINLRDWIWIYGRCGLHVWLIPNQI